MKKVLIVVTSHSKLGTTDKKTGYYLPEVSHPTDVFAKAGYEIDFMSPQGGLAPMDSHQDLSDPINKSFVENPDLMKKVGHTFKPSEVNYNEYEAIFFAGGHGVMWDFRDNKNLQHLASQFYENGKVVSAVCHGPAALVDVKLSNGNYLVEGKKVAGFSNEEEVEHETADIVPFLLETSLKERGGIYSNSAPWQEHVQVDGALITGQNPASAKKVAEEVVSLLESQAH